MSLSPGPLRNTPDPHRLVWGLWLSPHGIIRLYYINVGLFLTLITHHSLSLCWSERYIDLLLSVHIKFAGPFAPHRLIGIWQVIPGVTNIKTDPHRTIKMNSFVCKSTFWTFCITLTRITPSGWLLSAAPFCFLIYQMHSFPSYSCFFSSCFSFFFLLLLHKPFFFCTFFLIFFLSSLFFFLPYLNLSCPLSLLLLYSCLTSSASFSSALLETKSHK
jgi:hypothetical protein